MYFVFWVITLYPFSRKLHRICNTKTFLNERGTWLLGISQSGWEGRGINFDVLAGQDVEEMEVERMKHWVDAES